MPHFFECNFKKAPSIIKDILIKKGWRVENVVPCQEPTKGAPCQFRIDNKDGVPVGRVGFSYEDLDDEILGRMIKEAGVFYRMELERLNSSQKRNNFSFSLEKLG